MESDRTFGVECFGQWTQRVVISAVLSGLAVMPACTKNTVKDANNAANGVQNTANSITNTLTAVNGAEQAVEKTLHAGASTSSGGSPVPTQQNASLANPTPGPAAACPIDDMVDGNNQVLPVAGRGGYWYSYVDDAGSTITPPGKATFVMASTASKDVPAFAARFSGKIGTAQIVYAGIGFNLSDPKTPYDASRYTGISFWAKAAAGSSTKVRFKIPDANTDPDGHVCTQCYNDFGTDLVLTEEWHQYVIRFSEMAQLQGWGAPHPAGIRRSALYGMQWQVNSPGTNYDLWVTNVAFTGCP